MFSVRLLPMAQAAEQLRPLPGQLNNCSEKLKEIQRSLRQFSYMDASCSNLKKMEERTEELSSKILMAEMTLTMVQKQYQRKEEEIICYCEENGRTSGKGKVSYYDFSWVNQFLKTL